jgi:hypothetical protein
VFQVVKEEGTVQQSFVVDGNGEVKEDFFGGEGERMLCFFDNSPKHPSMLLNNLIHKY